MKLQILIDSKSKDEIVRWRSYCCKELLIKDPRFLPTQQYYIHTYFDISLLELEDYQWDKAAQIPSFRFGKNGNWEPFCPGTFAGPGLFTLSLFSLLKWEMFSKQLSEYGVGYSTRNNNTKDLPVIPNIFPPNSYIFYHRDKIINTLPYNYNSSFENIFIYRNFPQIQRKFDHLLEEK